MYQRIRSLFQRPAYILLPFFSHAISLHLSSNVDQPSGDAPVFDLNQSQYTKNSAETNRINLTQPPCPFFLNKMPKAKHCCYPRYWAVLVSLCMALSFCLPQADRNLYQQTYLEVILTRCHRLNYLLSIVNTKGYYFAC